MKKHNEPSELSQDFRLMREERQRRRAESRAISTAEIEQLQRFGYAVTAVTPYQFRITKDEFVIDIYPTSRKYHNINTGKRGNYKNLLPFIQTSFNRNK